MIDICGERESYTIDEILLRVYCIPKQASYGFRLLFVDGLCLMLEYVR